MIGKTLATPACTGRTGALRVEVQPVWEPAGCVLHGLRETCYVKVEHLLHVKHKLV